METALKITLSREGSMRSQLCLKLSGKYGIDLGGKVGRNNVKARRHVGRSKVQEGSYKGQLIFKKNPQYLTRL